MENPPAFPIPDVRDAFGDGIREGSDGMTLRDWFAGQALAGLCANSNYIASASWTEKPDAIVIERALGLAVAMLAARTQEPNPC